MLNAIRAPRTYGERLVDEHRRLSRNVAIGLNSFCRLASYWRQRLQYCDPSGRQRLVEMRLRALLRLRAVEKGGKKGGVEGVL